MSPYIPVNPTPYALSSGQEALVKIEAGFVDVHQLLALILGFRVIELYGLRGWGYAGAMEKNMQATMI